MARPSANPGMTPSVLDRLIDPESQGTAWLRGYTPRQMIDAVRRDTEDLLNSHQSESDVPEEFPESRRSILAFGMPDLPSLESHSEGRPEAVRRVLTEAIQRFEPRLRDVRVTLFGTGSRDGLRARFHIEGRLDADPSPDVAFETVVELTSGQASVWSGGA